MSHRENTGVEVGLAHLNKLNKESSSKDQHHKEANDKAVWCFPFLLFVNRNQDDKNDQIKLLPRTVTYLVAELQKYALLTTNIDIKGKAYEEIVGANLRGDRGEFFTPRNVIRMMVEVLEPDADDLIIDPACGSGGFIVESLRYIWENLETEAKKLNWNEKDLLEEKMEVAMLSLSKI